MSRGFTLLEVVAATVLLTMIVAAGIPFLRIARTGLDAAATPVVRVDHPELEAAIEDLLRQRPSLVVECLTQPAGLPVEWTSNDRVYHADVHLTPVINATDQERRTTHTWAVFTVDGAELLRWLRVPSPLLEGGGVS